MAITLPATKKPALSGTHRLSEASIHPSICAAGSSREDEGELLFNLFLLNLCPGLHLLILLILLILDLLILNNCPLHLLSEVVSSKRLGIMARDLTWWA